jgi:class 3 adenylate cyclase
MSDSRYQARVQDLIGDAEEHAARGDWDAVRDLARAALSLAPGSVEAQRLLGDAETAAPAPGERRQLTVMFCDVVGSTILGQQRDPEIVREVLRRYQGVCDAVVRQYGGHIATFVGDGVLAYFGHPTPHEDDPHRAVRAGLDILQALEPVTAAAREQYDLDLSVRAAVHTGLVVRAEMGSPSSPDRDAIVGDTPNLAARLQDHAEPGTLLVSQATYELVRGWFLVAPRGELHLKGYDHAVSAYRVLDEAPTASRIEVQGALSPFVGRGEQVVRLGAAWDAVVTGGSGTWVIRGEAGVGKSRLADVLRRRVDGVEGTAFVTHCSSYRTTSALYPARRLIERAAGIEPGQTGDVALGRLWSILDDVALADALPWLANLLGLPAEPWAPAPELDGAQLRHELLQSLVQWLEALTGRSPVLLLVDDVQWADPTTLDLIGLITEARIPRLLLVLTARDGFVAPWNGVDLVDLARLSTDELRELARRLPDGRRLDPEQLDEVALRSDGIPLFLEELLRTRGLASREPHSDGTIPAALRDLLLARFAVPGADLRVAQVIATIGPGASRAVIERCVDVPSAELDGQLAALVEAHVLITDPDDQDLYRFRHHLLADLAYDTQLHEVRRRVHGRVADVLLDDAASDQAVIAHHLERADRFVEAVTALTQAAEDAQALGALDEAGELLDRAIELLDHVPTEGRADIEFTPRLLRGMNITARLGHGADAAVRDFAAAAALVPSLGTSSYLDDDAADDGSGSGWEQLWSVYGLWASFLIQGKLDECDDLTSDTLTRVRPDGRLHAAFAPSQGFVSFFRGDVTGARRDLATYVRAIEPLELPASLPIPNHPLPIALCHQSYAEALAGELDAARRTSDRALAVAEAMPFPRGPFSLAYALAIRAAIEFLSSDIPTALHYSAQQADVAKRHGYTMWILIAELQTAMVEDAVGVEGAADRAMQIMADLRSMGAVVWSPMWHASLGQVKLLRADLEAAVAQVDAAERHAETTGAHFWSAEIRRLRGLIALAEDPSSPLGLELCREAAQLAERQGARAFELRARQVLCERSDDPDDLKALAQLLEAGEWSSFPEAAVAQRLVADRI